MDFEAVVIGSGFGGAILSCRLGNSFPSGVLVLERGKRYPMGSFPRTTKQFSESFWNVPSDTVKRPSVVGDKETHGLYDVRNFRHMDTVTAAGLGGGSLIYANVFMLPPREALAHWPASCSHEALQPYYRVAKTVLGARPVPAMNHPDRHIQRTRLFQDAAEKMGRKSELTDIMVFFGNDFEKPTPIGVQERNAHGAVQTSCTYCGECDVGCNTHSKNTLDLNYLYAAEKKYGVDVRTEQLAERIVPLDANGKEDSTGSGEFGYRVFIRDLSAESQIYSVDAKRVIVSAGAIGTTEFLLRCRDVHKTLPALNSNLGRRFSANGDFLSFAIDGKGETGPNYGPVITQRIDCNLFENFDRDRAFILEDAAYPPFLTWFVSASRPGLLWLGPIIRSVKSVWQRLTSRSSTGHIGYALGDLLDRDISSRSSVLLCMGLDKGDGAISLDALGNADMRWPYRNSLKLYRSVLKTCREFAGLNGSRLFLPMPTWLLPFRKNICVHALGGCILSETPDQGVVSSSPENFGEVYNYKNLFVADGSILPGPVGANPTATISALSERVAEGITRVKPTTEL